MAKGFYDLGVLNLFRALVALTGTNLTEKADDIRRQFRDINGAQAPPWDPARRRKYWVDPAYVGATSKDVVTYKIFENGQLVSMSMTRAEAGSVNLPGAFVYPAYSPAPTLAVADGQTIGPNSLSAQREAQELAVDMGLELGENRANRINWNGETRRMFELLFKGSWVNVGLLLEMRNSEGQGSPGKWDLTGPRIVWVPERRTDNGVYDPRPVVPVPCRDLFDYERIMPAGGMVHSWVVVDTRVESVYNPAPPVVVSPGGGGGDSGEVKGMLMMILDRVVSIERRLKGEPV